MIPLWRRLSVLGRTFAAGKGIRGGLQLVRLRLLRDEGGGGEPVEVRVRGLGGGPLALRPGTSDIYAFADNFLDGFHLPPEEVRGDDMRQIVEIGTNVGFGLAELAHRYPHARLVGVEPDPGNAALARRNVAAFGDRCQVVEAGAWDSDTELVVTGSKQTGFQVRPRVEDDADELPSVTGISMSTVLEKYAEPGLVDYVLVSAERSESRVLRSEGWADRVRSIRVETYLDDDYSPNDTRADLERLGFRAWLEPGPYGGAAAGVRDV